MGRISALAQHPDRARLELELLAGRNILQIASDSGISASALYKARQALEAERDARQEAQDDASRTGAALRYAALAGEARRARQDATLTGNHRLARDFMEVERKLLNDLVAVSPETRFLGELREAEQAAEQIAAALTAVLKAVNRSYVFEVAAKTLRAEGASEVHVLPLDEAAQNLRKIGR